jgi:hypothetical protein
VQQLSLTTCPTQAHLLRDGGPLHPFHAVVLRLKTADETVIAPALNELSVKMADTLSIGSYPVSAQRDGAGIVISLEGVSTQQPRLLRDALPCFCAGFEGEC